MKIITALVVALMLSGCSTIKDLWPTPHDPALAQAWVNVKIELSNARCADKTAWTALLRDTEYLKTYAEFRSDNQRKSAAGLQDSVRKALDTSSLRVCEHNLSLAKARLDVLRTAWSGR